MPKTLEGGMPPLVLDNGCKIVIEARDATTGNAVTGVKVSDVNIYGIDLTADNTPGLYGPLPYISAGSGV